MEFEAYKNALKFVLVPGRFAGKLGPTAQRIVDEIFIPIEVRSTQVKDAVKLLSGQYKSKVNQALGLRVRDIVKADWADENSAVIPLYAKILNIMESHGANRELSVNTLIEKIKHQGKANRDLTRGEAEEIVDTFISMNYAMRYGSKSQNVNFPGMGSATGTITDMQGYQSLVDKDDYFQMMSPENLQMMVGSQDAMYFPHHLQPFPNEQALKDFMRKRMGRKEFDKYERSLSKRSQDDSRPLYGSLDFQRIIPGTMEEKLIAGVPLIRDPFESFSRYMFQVNHTYDTGLKMGFMKAEQENFVNMMKRIIGRENATVSPQARAGQRIGEKAGVEDIPGDEEFVRSNSNVEHLFGEIAHIALNSPWEPEAQRKAASLLTAFNVATKLTFAVAANMGQIAQTATFNGLGNTIKALHSSIKNDQKNSIARAVSAFEGTLLDNHTNSFVDRPFKTGGLGSAIANTFQFVAEQTLSKSGFRRVESFNRLVGAGAAMHRATEIVIKAAGMSKHGVMLKGKQLESARRHAKSMGFELDTVVGKVRRAGLKDTPDGPSYAWFSSEEGMQWFQRTLFQGSQVTQFMTTNMTRPTFWGTPYGRVIFQFKTFAMQHYRFLRDQIMGELGRGNAAPLAIYMGVAPVAGELSGGIKEWVKDGRFDRGENGMARYLQNMMYIGGAGVITDLGQAARYEQLGEAILGPSVSDFVGWGEHLARLNGNGFLRDLGRLPMARVARRLHTVTRAIGEVTYEYGEDMIETYGSRDDGPIGNAISSGRLIHGNK